MQPPLDDTLPGTWLAQLPHRLALLHMPPVCGWKHRDADTRSAHPFLTSTMCIQVCVCSGFDKDKCTCGEWSKAEATTPGQLTQLVHVPVSLNHSQGQTSAILPPPRKQLVSSPDLFLLYVCHCYSTNKDPHIVQKANCTLRNGLILEQGAITCC